MKKMVSIWLFSCSIVQAITWDFDTNGDSQGWYARESIANAAAMDQQPLAIEVSDGMLRVHPRPYEAGVNPTVLLVSPELQLDSRLFDRVEMRMRLVHTRPVVGRVLLSWTNQHNRTRPGMDPGFVDPVTGKSLDRFEYAPSSGPVTFTTEWQEIRLRGFAGAPGLVWADTLIDIRLDFFLAEISAVAPGISGPEEVPAALEIDWVRLTGVEEQLSGELSPPSSPPRPLPGTLFGPAVFQPLNQGGLNKVLLGDLDGDRDLDAVLRYNQNGKDGLITAVGDGTGWLRPGSWRLAGQDVNEHSFLGINPKGSDFNGDGYLDLAVGAAIYSAQVWLNNQEGGFERNNLWDTCWLRAVADVDRDGDQDLCLLETAREENPLVWMLNDGGGHFTEEVVLNPGNTERLFFEVADFTYDGNLEVVQTPPYVGPDSTGMAIYALNAGYQLLTASPAYPLELIQHLVLEMPMATIAFFSDLDHDGDVDVVSTAQVVSLSLDAKEVVAMVNQGDGLFEVVPWLPEGVILERPSGRYADNASRSLAPWDLDGDGIVDVALLDRNTSRGENVLVMLGRKGSMPVVEGQYSVPGGTGEMDGGDIDGDGDLDLVLPTSQEGGGIYVLRNLSAERRATAIEAVNADPLRFELGANYPNPFNPTTVIPFTLPQAGLVRVAVYDLLGQRVRELVVGVAVAGTHQVEWDGRAEGGQQVGSGVYVYRLEAGDRVLSGKMVKVE